MNIANVLHEYLRFRAEFEGVRYDFTPAFFHEAIRHGCCEFFGITFDRDSILNDNQNPSALAVWKARQ
jgi:hypothetical protein